MHTYLVTGKKNQQHHYITIDDTEISGINNAILCSAAEPETNFPQGENKV